MDDDHYDDPTEALGDHRFPDRGPGEGVRLIGDDEAAAAIESGQVSGRNPEDAPRFGDVPPAPSGPRPPLRFPLDADPASVPRPPVAATEPFPPITPARGPREPGPTDSGSIPLPHWTEPPTGEVPKILPGSDVPRRQGSDEDLDVWSSLSTGPRWREQSADWDSADFDDAVLADESTRVGALGHRDDEVPFARRDAPTVRPPDDRVRPLTPRPGPIPPPSGRAGGPQGLGDDLDETEASPPSAPSPDLSSRVVTGLVFGGVVLLAAWLGPAALLVVAGAVIVVATAEFYAALRKRGFHPATLLGLVATVSVIAAAYWRGEQALPLVLTLFVVFTLLWYLAGVVRARAAVNVAVSLTGFLYVGFLGSFAALLLRLPDRRGVAVLVGALLATAAYDIGAYAFGKAMGRTLMAPDISPKKTWEGMFGASVFTLIVCLAIVRAIAPWNMGRAFWLAVTVLVTAPLGDLCESMIKRDLGVKDMGAILPGHGGVLDRIDALLFVIPATYYLVRLLDIA